MDDETADGWPMAAMGWPDGRRRTRGRHGPSASVSNRRLLRPTSSPWWRLAHHGVDTAMMLNKIEKQEFVLRSDVRPRGWVSQKKSGRRTETWCLVQSEKLSEDGWPTASGRWSVLSNWCRSGGGQGRYITGLYNNMGNFANCTAASAPTDRRKRWRRRAADNRGTSATNTAWWRGDGEH